MGLAVGRLIPARAGRTAPTDRLQLLTGAHPRSRGADRLEAARISVATGSSPLARGGLALASLCARRAGLIPARAGRTTPRTATRCRSTAHPRSRGADRNADGRPVHSVGSSPLARGGRVAGHGISRHRRLIPARAGRTGGGRVAARRRPAHPRSRGADDHARHRVQAGHGSSPLARGGPEDHRGLADRLGLIPARAGRTGMRRWKRGRWRAHPRSRGADPSYAAARALDTGSSPLARGGRADAGAEGQPDGLIPARAGRTRPAIGDDRARRAHPRSRGADTC